MSTHGSQLETTVVVGGSVAGLLAAAAAASHTKRVVLVERDPLPPDPGTRPGTPQAGQIHGLLASGREAMETLLPGLTDDLVDQGGRVGDIGTDVRWHLGGHRVAARPVGAVGLAVSRPLLEAYVRGAGPGSAQRHHPRTGPRTRPALGQARCGDRGPGAAP